MIVIVFALFLFGGLTIFAGYMLYLIFKKDWAMKLYERGKLIEREQGKSFNPRIDSHFGKEYFIWSYKAGFILMLILFLGGFIYIMVNFIN